MVIDCCFLGCGFALVWVLGASVYVVFDALIRVVVDLFSVVWWFVCGLMFVMLLDTINSVVIYYV